MKILRLALAALASLLLAHPLPAADATPEFLAPANRLVLGENDAPWQPLLAALRADGSVYATFTENRYFPFKQVPVVFTGEMRFSPERGLSLHYLKPEDRLMILDTKGVILRDARGRSREQPADPRVQSASLALLHVMRFDLAELARDFDLYGKRDGETWKLGFVPRKDEAARVLSKLVVTGEGTAVKKIEMRKSAFQAVEILIGETRPHATFPPEELTKFFR